MVQMGYRVPLEHLGATASKENKEKQVYKD